MSFFNDVYVVVKDIPPGKVATYGQIARLLGNPRMARQVGWAMAACPENHTPCHRVLNRFGACCKGFAFGGEEVQRALLEAEGIAFGPDGCVDLTRYGWERQAE